jgi:hypothetical protein
MPLPKNWARNNPDKEKTRREKIRQSKLGKPRPPHVVKILADLARLRTGDKNPSWKGGKTTPEHIRAMEERLGRKLVRNGRNGEVVHHINGDHSDNRIENLRLYQSHSDHIKEEQRLNSFAKQILYGKLLTELRPALLQAYQKFNV